MELVTLGTDLLTSIGNLCCLYHRSILEFESLSAEYHHSKLSE